jgi:hypothetical protein
MSDMRHRIKEAVVAVAEVVLVRAWRKIEYRFDVFRAANGAHIGTF